MTTKDQNITMYQGEDKQLNFAITDESGNAKSLTGATAEWVVRISEDSSTNVISKTTSSGMSIIDINSTDDGVRVTLDAVDTRSLTPRSYYHEVRVTDSSGDENVVSAGWLYLLKSTTA